MTWNWQQPDWPRFRYDIGVLTDLEGRYLRQTGELSGTIKHLANEEKQAFTITLISSEALKTAEIEGEFLNRDSLQSSIRRQFGLPGDHRRIPLAEQGLADMMVNLYRTFAEPISHEALFSWHATLTQGRHDLAAIGGYRTHDDPMQIISGPVHEPVIHFEAPPSSRVPSEMDAFVAWFNRSAPGGESPLPALTRAGLAHLWFVSIHPFEDGNGRIARALAEKALAQAAGHPTLVALAQTIQRHKAAYYAALAHASRGNEITGWLLSFARTILEAQAQTVQEIEFLIAKAKFHERFRGALNERQEKVIARLFEEGPQGFTGGLSAKKYIRITGASHATATRDLTDLVAKEALTRTGQLKGTRYTLKLDPIPSRAIPPGPTP